MTSLAASEPSFDALNLAPSVLKAVREAGYETPTPIQTQIIPLMLQGRDVLGQAQTGTGKTAAFALPLLSMLDLKCPAPQIMVLTPTRELALQVAEAFKGYAKHLRGFHVLPIYGGQAYDSQLRRLHSGVHVVVGTPGRVMDHMRRGTLQLDRLTSLVLDEADEMLRMGFADDVRWILEQTPPTRRTALFSATMPVAIRRIADAYLHNPAVIHIERHPTGAETIQQQHWVVGPHHKLDALTRILEAEPFDAMLIFVRTKLETVELSQKLQARGFSAAALSSDSTQAQREKTVAALRSGALSILVATDVAARGLDVDRISHVVNYDIPCDTEAYVHRIGRTGRAGRSGKAIVFVAPREMRMLRAIEAATRHKIRLMELPSTESINTKRVTRFKQRITDTLATADLDLFIAIVEQYAHEHDTPPQRIAAALARMAQGDEPLLLTNNPPPPVPARRTSEPRPPASTRSHHAAADRAPRARRRGDEPTITYRLPAGSAQGVSPGAIVGAIANGTGLSGSYIGHIAVCENHSTVALPDGLPPDFFKSAVRQRVGGKALHLTPDEKTTPPRHSQPGADTPRKAPPRRDAPKKQQHKRSVNAP